MDGFFFKFGVQVSIECVIIENENWVKNQKRSKSSKNAKMGIFGRQGDTYAVVGQPSNLVVEVEAEEFKASRGCKLIDI
jgi:hypothetical protein